MAVVRVKVRGVRAWDRRRDELSLYVDSTGRSRRPTYVNIAGIDMAGTYNNFHTRGWARQPRRTFSCGESLTLYRPTRNVRIMEYRLPGAYFGNYGAKFAVKTVRRDRHGRQIGRDWAPRARTLSRTFVF